MSATPHPGPPLPPGAARDRLQAALSEVSGAASHAMVCCRRAERSRRDLETWLAELDRGLAKLAERRRELGL